MADEILLAGLDRVGLSLAMALRNPKLEVRLVGYDPDKKLARRALKDRDIDRILGSLHEAPAECDLCLLSLPPEAMIPALETLSAALHDGALVLGLGPIQSHVIAWAAEHLPAGRHYIGILPVEGVSAIEASAKPEDAPRADLFGGGVMALALPPGTPQASIDVALSLANILGARPFFVEPAELDAATASMETLPVLMAEALMSLSSSLPAWRDVRRITGAAFAHATALIETFEPPISPGSLLLQRGHLIDRLDALQAELGEWRALIASGDEGRLKKRLEATSRAHDDWRSNRRRVDWGAEERSATSPIQGPGVLERMFGLGRRRNPPSQD